MLVSEMEMQLSEDHEGIIELPADAPLGEIYAKWAGLDDPVIEIKLTPNRPDCTGVARRRARPRRRRHGQVHRQDGQAGEGRRRLPGHGHARLRRDAVALPRLRAAAGARREERTVARLAAEAPHRDRPAPDQCAGRHHQLHHLRPRPAAARVRRRQGEGQSRGAAREAGRAIAGARRQDLHARRHDVRDRRRRRPGIARRHHGRRSLRLRRRHHRRADRVGAVGAAQHRADRAQARHQFGRALPLRARRRSGLPGAGARARDPDGARPLRRHAVRDHGRRRSAGAGAGDRLPALGIEAPRRPRRAVPGSAQRAQPARLHGRRAGQEREDRRAVVAAGRPRQGRHRRRGHAHRRRRPRAVDAVRSRPQSAQADPHHRAGAHPQGQARARRARHGRGGDVVVRLQAAGRAVRRRQAASWRSPIRSRPTSPTCGRASCPA